MKDPVIYCESKNAILVWEFDKAPQELKDLSRNGGDEDWVVYVPAGALKCGWTPVWLEDIDTCGEPQRIQMECGALVYIGSHA